VGYAIPLISVCLSYTVYIATFVSDFVRSHCAFSVLSLTVNYLSLTRAEYAAVCYSAVRYATLSPGHRLDDVRCASASRSIELVDAFNSGLIVLASRDFSTPVFIDVFLPVDAH